MELTYEEVKVLAQRAIDARGADFVYPDEWREDGSCQYRRPDEPEAAACLVGWIAMDLGVLSRIPEDKPASAALMLAGVKLDEKGRVFVNALQEWQDDSETWGDSLEFAISDVEDE